MVCGTSAEVMWDACLDPFAKVWGSGVRVYGACMRLVAVTGASVRVHRWGVGWHCVCGLAGVLCSQEGLVDRDHEHGGGPWKRGGGRVLRLPV